mmetsp:Transcript_20710/g.27220  ORF Transcript_20710/g.27220 Transcript_20710/m.27220 type:complete len:234 (+) Transcript_20710:572-1273(+)
MDGSQVIDWGFPGGTVADLLLELSLTLAVFACTAPGSLDDLTSVSSLAGGTCVTAEDVLGTCTAAPALLDGVLLLAEHREGTVPLSAWSALSVLDLILAGLRKVLNSRELLPCPLVLVERVVDGPVVVGGGTDKCRPGDGPRPRPRRDTTPWLLLVALLDDAGETVASVVGRGATTFSVASLSFSATSLFLFLLLLNRTVLFKLVWVLGVVVFGCCPSRGVTLLTVPSELGVV